MNPTVTTVSQEVHNATGLATTTPAQRSNNGTVEERGTHTPEAGSATTRLPTAGNNTDGNQTSTSVPD
ncbi:hypothetical protein CSUI_004325, partial [Cystoisospora suis]